MLTKEFAPEAETIEEKLDLIADQLDKLVQRVGTVTNAILLLIRVAYHYADRCIDMPQDLRNDLENELLADWIEDAE